MPWDSADMIFGPLLTVITIQITNYCKGVPRIPLAPLQNANSQRYVHVITSTKWWSLVLFPKTRRVFRRDSCESHISWVSVELSLIWRDQGQASEADASISITRPLRPSAHSQPGEERDGAFGRKEVRGREWGREGRWDKPGSSLSGPGAPSHPSDS